MSSVVYSMSVSADGYIAGPDGEIDWSAPDEERFRFHTEETGELGAHLLGRRLYETMGFWETADSDSAALGELGEQLQVDPDYLREFALTWQALPKVVFSRTLDAVEGANTSLAHDDLSAQVSALREAVDGDIGVGGAELAAEAARLGLIDEYRVFLAPVALGGGIPFFPREHRVDMELVETRTFSSRVVYARYRAARRRR
jgi:dihydrofolate reductase